MQHSAGSFDGVSIQKAIPEVYNKDKKMVQDLLENMKDQDMEVQEHVTEADDIGNLSDESDQAPVVKLVNLMIVQGIQAKASDIHIERWRTRSACATVAMVSCGRR